MRDRAGAVALGLANCGAVMGWNLAYRHTLIAVALAGLTATVPAGATTINYRSIGTDSGVLYSAGDASINSGASVVTFAGATLPADIGPGDWLQIEMSGATITREEFQVAGQKTSPVTMPAIQGGSNQTYVLLISVRNNAAVTDVSGGGLVWTEQIAQCGDDNETSAKVWTAQGSPATSFQAQITYVSTNTSIVAVLLRYSGVGTIEGAAGENINGPNDVTCGSASNTDATQLTLTSSVNGSVHVVGLAPRDETISTLAPEYAEIAMAAYGAGPNETNMIACDGTFDPAATHQFQATIGNTADWATAGIVLTPADFSVYYVLTRDSDTQVTIQGTASSTLTNAVYELRRAYNTMQAWEDGRQGDLVADDRREVGVCYNDGTFTDQLLISGSTTDATRFMRLTVAEGERHTGVQNTGAVIDAQGGWTNGNAIDVEDEYTRIEWLEIKAIQDQGHGIYFSAGPAGDNGTVSHVLTHSFWQWDPNSGVYVDAAGINIRNCIMTGGSSRAISVMAGSATIENCTIIGVPGSGHGVFVPSGTVSVMNTISVDHVAGRDFYIETTGTAVITSFGYNLFSTTGGGFDPDGYEGNNQAPPVDLEDLFVTATSSADLHLESSGHDALDNALDTAASGASPVDIDGVTRQLTWDIGADEVVVHPHTLTYRSIGTNAAVLYSTGTATIDSLSPVVTFSGATLPTNIGQGDRRHHLPHPGPRLGHAGQGPGAPTVLWPARRDLHDRAGVQHAAGLGG